MANDPAGSTASALIVVAAALTRDDGRVLVQRRPAGKAHAGLWEFPGGKVEPGERAADALARELAEELGIAVEPAALVPTGFSTGNAGARELLLLLFVVRRWLGEPVALCADTLAWYRPDELAAMPMPAADQPLVAGLGRWLAALNKLEARPGIEPGCKDLQSSASPLRHRASTHGMPR